tara:strand:+ start:4628 stop:4876 length:249 start_codon:yes stop_codon:yes gene_type:complete
MIVYICESCKDGFDIEVSGGIECPECGSGRWKQCNRLPDKAMKYRIQWMEKYGEFPLNEDEKPGDFFDDEGNFRGSAENSGI